MAWVLLDDRFSEHPKVAQVGPLGIAMQVAGLAYCNRNLTDGYVPASVARTLLDWRVTDPEGVEWTVSRFSGTSGVDMTCEWVCGLLVNAEMWHDQDTIKVCDSCYGSWPTHRTDGYLIHDFLVHQKSREAVEQARKRDAERKRGGFQPDSGRSPDAPNPNPLPNNGVITPFLASYEGGDAKASGTLLTQLLALARDDLDRRKIERAAKGLSEADLLNALEAARGPVKDRLAAALARLKLRRQAEVGA